MTTEKFVDRHIGINEQEIQEMLNIIGVNSLKQLIFETIPDSNILKRALKIPQPYTENKILKKLREVGSKNKIFRSFIGQGYYDTILPSVIRRHVLEDATWYTSYTPYQAEISQGRLEALLNFQTLITELSGMEISNCSLLDEATAAAEAMSMMYGLRSVKKKKKNANLFFVDENIFPQTLVVLSTRAKPLDIEIIIGKFDDVSFTEDFFGSIVQYPAADGKINNYLSFVEKAHTKEVLVTVAADLMSLCLLVPPSSWNADIVVGTTQRFGIPLGFGGPHAAFLACRKAYQRHVPGRIIGISKDVNGNPALRMTLQTREQHIKRERATSNICTAQALLASMAGFYAVYHGYEGLLRIAMHMHATVGFLAENLKKLGFTILHNDFFDTIQVVLPDNISVSDIQKLSIKEKINFHYPTEQIVGISTDEKTDIEELNVILSIFAAVLNKKTKEYVMFNDKLYFDTKFKRGGTFLQQNVFKKYRSETAIIRYIKQLEKKDIGLNTSMISLGSCTMKLNPATAMLPVTWPEFSNIHPFVPNDQSIGYLELITELEQLLCEITNLSACTLQPNSGASGEYTGLLIIRKYHSDRGEAHRNIVLIPQSAHGTNPASCAMTGQRVVVVKCDEKGNVDVKNLKEKAEKFADNLSAFMLTYPSTHGVFESGVIECVNIIHRNGGLVYMDGANMNAQCGLSSPGQIGADICHLNLHKTFAIPHGGGGPGVGPICVTEKLAKYLPTHPLVKTGGENGISAVSAAPYGSPNILTISYAYILMLGYSGLKKSSEIAILNANYLAIKLEQMGMKILYKGDFGRVAHEFILDCRPLKTTAGITDVDIAKRLMDFGFHAPTLSFPVHGTLMIEPTESEPKEELDRFIEALQCIYSEIQEIAEGKADKDDNVLKNAPHTLAELCADEWTHNYPREKAAFPLPWVNDNKFWVPCKRVNDAYGDRHLFCTCDALENWEHVVE